MNAPQGTKWIVVGLGGISFDERLIECVESGSVVAAVWPDGEDFDDLSVAPVREANARLIAAAPELLAAARTTLSYITTMREAGIIQGREPWVDDLARLVEGL